MAEVGKTRPAHQAYVASANHRNAHRSPLRFNNICRLLWRFAGPGNAPAEY